jgi:hypothetical protein
MAVKTVISFRKSPMCQVLSKLFTMPYLMDLPEHCYHTLCPSSFPKCLLVIQTHLMTIWHATEFGEIVMKPLHSGNKHLQTIPALTLLPRIWLIAALSFRVHSATTFALISFMYNMKAFRGFLMWGLFGSCSFLCSCWGFLKGDGGGSWGRR